MNFVANIEALCYDEFHKKTGTGGRVLAGQIIRALIVDDEKAAMDATVSALSNFSQIEIAAAVNSSAGMIAALKKKRKSTLRFLTLKCRKTADLKWRSTLEKIIPLFNYICDGPCGVCP